MRNLFGIVVSLLFVGCYQKAIAPQGLDPNTHFLYATGQDSTDWNSWTDKFWHEGVFTIRNSNYAPNSCDLSTKRVHIQTSQFFSTSGAKEVVVRGTIVYNPATANGRVYLDVSLSWASGNIVQQTTSDLIHFTGFTPPGTYSFELRSKDMANRSAVILSIDGEVGTGKFSSGSNCYGTVLLELRDLEIVGL